MKQGKEDPPGGSEGNGGEENKLIAERRAKLAELRKGAGGAGGELGTTLGDQLVLISAVIAAT